MFKKAVLELLQELSTGRCGDEERGRRVGFGTMQQFRDPLDVSVVAGGDAHRPTHRSLHGRHPAKVVVSDGLASGKGQNPSHGL